MTCSMDKAGCAFTTFDCAKLHSWIQKIHSIAGIRVRHGETGWFCQPRPRMTPPPLLIPVDFGLLPPTRDPSDEVRLGQAGSPSQMLIRRSLFQTDPGLSVED